MIRALPGVQVDWAGEYVFLGDDGLGHSIVFDSSHTGPAKGMSPMKALLACLAACSGMDVVAILGKRKQSLTSLRIQVHGTQPEHGCPKPYTSISLKYILTGESLDARCVEEAVRDSMEKFCSVAATITGGTTKIDHTYEIVNG